VAYVLVAVQADDVSFREHSRDQLWLGGRPRSDREERGPSPKASEQGEQPGSPDRIGPVVKRKRHGHLRLFATHRADAGKRLGEHVQTLGGRLS
jgi:hypothetical protein